MEADSGDVTVDHADVRDASVGDAGSDMGVKDVGDTEAEDFDPVDIGGADGGDADVLPNLPLSRFIVDWHPAAALQSYGMHLGAVETVYEPVDPNEIAGFPRAWGLDVMADGVPGRKLVVSFTQNDDDGDADQVISYLVSEDLGRTFPSATLRLDAVSPTQMARLADGRVLDVGFVPVSGTADGLVIHGARSEDDGVTWDRFESPVSFDSPIFPLGRTHLGLLVSDDGAVMTPHYVRYRADSGHSSVLLRSEDAGQTWHERGVIARSRDGMAYNETTIAYAVDGSLVAVCRVHNVDGSTASLVVMYSADDGRTWTQPAPLELSIDGGDAGPRVGVDPHLMLMPNGVLVLSAGRPDNWIALSFDGLGRVWEEGTTTYVNRPQLPAPQTRGSSGYSGIAVAESNRLLLTGDNCAPSWGCPAVDSAGNPIDDNYTINDHYRVWRRLVDVVSPGVGKIDLAGKLRAGTIGVTSDMDYETPSRPRTRLEAAFDGSVALWSTAARANAAEGSVTIDLDREFYLHRVGLAIAIGRAAEADVRVSLDGVGWSVPVLETGERTHHAIEYFELPSAVRARFVKITTRSVDCPPELGTTCALLNEVELYTEVDSFENTPLNDAPRGVELANLATVERSTLGDSGRVLRLHDTSDSVHARAIFQGAGAAHQALEFRCYPVSLPGVLMFDVLGVGAAQEDVTAYHLAVFADGSLRQWEVGTATWTAFAPPGTAPIGAWSTIQVDATLTRATVRVGAVIVGDIAPSTPGAVALTGYSFGSAGTVPTGDDVLVDDVRFVAP